MNPILFQLSERLYVRDPQRTATGQLLLQKSITLMDRVGFEQFTFRKLADEMSSTEATIYRYFENKHRLLLYLIDWYWTLIGFSIDWSLTNIRVPEERLRICLKIISGMKKTENGFYPVDQDALQRIVIGEMDKTYFTKSVDADLRDGLLTSFNDTCKKISRIVKEINPKYQYPNSLVSTAIQAANHQLFYCQHLPGLSDIKEDPKNMNEKLYRFLETLVFRSIKA